jgi:hypothetical protein
MISSRDPVGQGVFAKTGGPRSLVQILFLFSKNIAFIGSAGKIRIHIPYRIAPVEKSAEYVQSFVLLQFKVFNNL